ncbi:hypothetical protein [Phycisphaera mikurensis]|uniref:Uncharacterized protein n=1 Tax=Phycisphaera mikurensis (strain NBRC 102666 / KCTC 22515 / FYK2301M01) TaxID=1142394 RepID=I0IFC6_PHYMF|nr:hypothetical protein [Phycisphaera mikurensis]MBB6440643.1 hypothetical protein [Phycisphaera mikurensis]BAM03964.1 hypothetical protein PSMK_18050 [Phycisphaera mikurensis NBRC 102666]
MRHASLALTLLVLLAGSPARAFQVLFHTGEPQNIAQLEQADSSWAYSRNNADGLYLIHATIATYPGPVAALIDNFPRSVFANSVVEVPYAAATLRTPYPRHIDVLSRVLNAPPTLALWYHAGAPAAGRGLGSTLSGSEFDQVEARSPVASNGILMRAWGKPNRERVQALRPAAVVFEFNSSSSNAFCLELAKGTKWLLDAGYKVVWLIAPGESDTDPADPADWRSHVNQVNRCVTLMSQEVGRQTRMRSDRLMICPGGYDKGVQLLPETVVQGGDTRAANTVAGAVRQLLLRRPLLEGR